MSVDDQDPVGIGDSEMVLIPEEETISKVLRLALCPRRDTFQFKIWINLSPIVKKQRGMPDITKEELSGLGIQSITKRQYYSIVQSLFDPISLPSPVLLQGKMILRKT